MKIHQIGRQWLSLRCARSNAILPKASLLIALSWWLALTAIPSPAFAQGLVNFRNNSITLVSVNGSPTPPSTTPTYYYALLDRAHGDHKPH